MLRQCIFILLLLIGYHLSGQSISWEASVGAGITNLNDLSSRTSGEAGMTYQVGLQVSRVPQRHGFTAFAVRVLPSPSNAAVADRWAAGPSIT